MNSASLALNAVRSRIVAAQPAIVSRPPASPALRVVQLHPAQDPLVALQAIKQGADGVLLLGQPAEQRRGWQKERTLRLQSLLEFCGYERQRIQLDWATPASADAWGIVGEFRRTLAAFGPWRGDSLDAEQPPALEKGPRAGFPPVALNSAFRAFAAQLLQTGRVDGVLGWRQGSKDIYPSLATTPENVAHLFVGSEGDPNLATALIGAPGKTAVFLRPAERRTVDVLAAHGQVRRDDIIVIGAGENTEGCDVALNAATPADSLPSLDHSVDQIEAWTLNERAAFWAAQLSACVRCNACCFACPMCVAGVGAALPADCSPAVGLRDALAFHLARALSVAGACAACGACENACPQGIRLDLLTRKAARDAQEPVLWAWLSGAVSTSARTIV